MDQSAQPQTKARNGVNVILLIIGYLLFGTMGSIILGWGTGAEVAKVAMAAVWGIVPGCSAFGLIGGWVFGQIRYPEASSFIGPTPEEESIHHRCNRNGAILGAVAGIALGTMMGVNAYRQQGHSTPVKTPATAGLIDSKVAAKIVMRYRAR